MLKSDQMLEHIFSHEYIFSFSIEHSVEWIILGPKKLLLHNVICFSVGAGVIEFIICHAEVSIVFVEEKKIPEV